MYQPKISIITATFNAGETLEQTISSIANQSYKNIEYIIIDGGSTDNTLDLIHKYEKDIAYWVSEPDQGIYDAFNKGIQAATGDYIEIIGSDDCLTGPNTIAKVVDNLSEDTDILSCYMWIVDRLGYQHMYTNDAARDKATYAGGMIPHAGMFVKRELLLQHPFDTSYRIAADNKFFLTCYIDESVRFKYIDLPVAFFSGSGVSYTNNEKANQENDRVYKELGLPYRSAPQKGPKWAVRNFIKRTALYRPAMVIGSKINICEKHHCNNKICRWCGRQ